MLRRRPRAGDLRRRQGAQATPPWHRPLSLTSPPIPLPLPQDCLGGNCVTTLLATVSPAAAAFAESASTLRFAARAARVVNAPRVNEGGDQVTLLRKAREEGRHGAGAGAVCVVASACGVAHAPAYGRPGVAPRPGPARAPHLPHPLSLPPPFSPSMSAS